MVQQQCAMQEKCVSQLVSTAAMTTAAFIRFLQDHEPSSKSGFEGRPRPKTSSLILRISHAFERYQSCVAPVAPQALATQSKSQPPHGCQCLLSRPPLSPPDEMLIHCTERRLPAPQQASLHPFLTSETVSDRVAHQAACILGHLSPPSHASCRTSTPHRGCEGSHREEHVMEMDGLIGSAMVLGNTHLPEESGVKQPASLHRTMLACEGIAINSLFTHGLPTCRVCHSSNLFSFLVRTLSDDLHVNKTLLSA
jgi:hypothetical protein